jgi:hypothetical protein
MKTALTVIIVIAVVFVGIFYFTGRSTINNPAPIVTQDVGVPTQTAPNTSTGKTITLTFSAQNNSGETGTAVLSDENGQTKVVLSIIGQPADVSQPAHIHFGSCATLGAVKYPLNFPINGTSQTTVNRSLDQLLAELPLAINVHKSASEANIYVSCADIKTTSSSATSNTAPSTGPAPTPTPQPKATAPTYQAPMRTTYPSGGYSY